MSKERKFGGKIYKSGPFAMLFGKAQTEAKLLRSKGYSVRVIKAPKDINKSGKWYSIFFR